MGKIMFNGPASPTIVWQTNEHTHIYTKITQHSVEYNTTLDWGKSFGQLQVTRIQCYKIVSINSMENWMCLVIHVHVVSCVHAKHVDKTNSWQFYSVNDPIARFIIAYTKPKTIKSVHWTICTYRVCVPVPASMTTYNEQCMPSIFWDIVHENYDETGGYVLPLTFPHLHKN